MQTVFEMFGSGSTLYRQQPTTSSTETTELGQLGKLQLATLSFTSMSISTTPQPFEFSQILHSRHFIDLPPHKETISITIVCTKPLLKSVNVSNAQVDAGDFAGLYLRGRSNILDSSSIHAGTCSEFIQVLSSEEEEREDR